MWTALIILGIAGLLAWRAPHALKRLLIVGGVLILLGAVGIGGYIFVENRRSEREASRIKALFSAPERPQPLVGWQRKSGERYQWGFFNVSPTTAYACYCRMVKFNAAGVQVDEEDVTSGLYTFEPLDSSEVRYAMEEGWVPMLAGCDAHVRGTTTADPVEALMRTTFFKTVDAGLQASLLQTAGATEDFIREHINARPALSPRGRR
jgi:hypothetical protein